MVRAVMSATQPHHVSGSPVATNLYTERPSLAALPSTAHGSRIAVRVSLHPSSHYQETDEDGELLGTARPLTPVAIVVSHTCSDDDLTSRVSPRLSQLPTLRFVVRYAVMPRIRVMLEQSEVVTAIRCEAVPTTLAIPDVKHLPDPARYVVAASHTPRSSTLLGVGPVYPFVHPIEQTFLLLMPAHPLDCVRLICMDQESEA